MSTSEKTLRWNDPIVNIKWLIKKPILSDKDKNMGLSVILFCIIIMNKKFLDLGYQPLANKYPKKYKKLSSKKVSCTS